MQALVEMIAGFVALLAAVALSQFGVDLNSAPQNEREIHRVGKCADTHTGPGATAPVNRDC